MSDEQKNQQAEMPTAEEANVPITIVVPVSLHKRLREEPDFVKVLSEYVAERLKLKEQPSGRE